MLVTLTTRYILHGPKNIVTEKKKRHNSATIIYMASRENVRVKSITVCPCKIILVKIVTKIILVKIVAFYVSTRIAAI